MSDSGDRLVRSIKWAIVAVICLPIVIGIIAFASWRGALAKEVNRKLGAIKTAGLPASGEELNKWYAPVPDSDNAALVMTQAFALLRTFDDPRSNSIASLRLPSRSEPLSANDQQLLSDYIALNEPALAKARDALALPHSRYPLDASFGNNTPLPHLPRIRELARLEEYRAVVAGRSGHMSEAVAAAQNTLSYAQTLDNEPYLISQLQRIACLAIAFKSLERTLNSCEVEEKDLERLAALLGGIRVTNGMARGLIGDRAMHIPVFRMSWAEIKRLANLDTAEVSDSPERPVSGKSPWLIRETGIFERDLSFYLDAMQTNIDLALQAPPTNLIATNVIARIGRDAARKKYFISSILLPSTGRVLPTEASINAYLQATSTSIAIERFRLVNKRLPATIDDLVPKFLSAVPQDPFTAQPLLYKQIPKGYVVYSVDRDGSDDGGKEKPAKRKSTDRSSYDITFTVER